MQRLIGLAVLFVCYGWDGSGSGLCAATEPTVSPYVMEGNDFRVWQTYDGRVATLAFVDLIEDRVQLRRLDDSLGEVPLHRLSEADRDWVARHYLRLAVQRLAHVLLPDGGASPKTPLTPAVVSSSPNRSDGPSIPVRFASFQQPAADAAPPAADTALPAAPVSLTTEAWQDAAKPILGRKADEFRALVQRTDEADNAWPSRLVNGITYDETTKTVSWKADLAQGVTVTDETKKPFENLLQHDVPEALKIGTEQYEQLKFQLALVEFVPTLSDETPLNDQPDVKVQPSDTVPAVSTLRRVRCGCLSSLAYRCRCFIARLRIVWPARRCCR